MDFAHRLPMFWSSRSERIFRYCKRCYFFAYLGSHGGHDELAEPKLRQIHLLKNLIFSADYPGIVFNAVLRQLFYSVNFAEAEDEENCDGKISSPESVFVRAMRRKFFFDRRAMASGACLSDHKAPMTFELYYGLEEFEPSFDRLEKSLEQLYNDASRNGLFDYLESISPEYRVWLDRPLEVEISEKRFFVAPILCWHEGKWMRYLLNSDSPADMTLLLHRTMQKSFLRPDLVDFYILESGRLRKLDPVANLSESIRQINRSYDEIAEFRRFTQEIPEKTEDKSRCLQCRFRELCLI